MSGRWLYIHSKPPAQIYSVDAARSHLAPGLPMHRAEFETSATAAQLGAQNDSFRVSLLGINAALRSRLAAQGPYGVRVDVMDGGAVSRSGIISDIGNADDGSIDLDCEAPGWSSPLPLRTNADIGEFRNVQALPLRYGRAVPGACVRLDATGKRWLWADHACERITSLQIDGQDYGAWQWRNDVDQTGRPICIITTVDEIEEGAEVIAVGDGKRDSVNGALIVNPADMIYDLCALASLPVSRGDLVPFRAECLSRSIEISGSISGGTLQAALVELADSLHAVFSRSLPGLMCLLPRTTVAAVIPAQDAPTARAQRARIATRLRVRYALEDGEPRASLEARAPAVEQLRGVVIADAVLPWVRDTRVAVDVAKRKLADLARPAYDIPAKRQPRRVLPGQLATVTVQRLGLAGNALVISSQIDDTGSTPTLQLYIDQPPQITITAVSTAYTPEQYAGATVETQGNERKLTFRDTAGAPIVGAAATLNGSLTRTTDSAGVVRFPASAMPRGQHVVDVRKDGFNPIQVQAVV